MIVRSRVSLCFCGLVVAYACNGELEEPADPGGELGSRQFVARGGEVNLAGAGGEGAGGAPVGRTVGRCYLPGDFKCVEYSIDAMDGVEVARAEELCALSRSPSSGGAGGEASDDPWQEGACPLEGAASRCEDAALSTVTYYYFGTALSEDDQRLDCIESTLQFELL